MMASSWQEVQEVNTIWAVIYSESSIQNVLSYNTVCLQSLQNLEVKRQQATCVILQGFIFT